VLNEDGCKKLHVAEERHHLKKARHARMRLRALRDAFGERICRSYGPAVMGQFPDEGRWKEGEGRRRKPAREITLAGGRSADPF